LPTTALQALTYPATSAAPNVPADIQQLALDVEKKAVMVFASAAARTSAFTSASVTATEGMLSYLSDVNQVQFYDGSAWAPMPGQYIAATTTTSADIVQAAGANTVLTSTTFSAVSGVRYEAHFESSFQFSVGSLAIVTFRHASGSSVTTASTAVGSRMMQNVSTTKPVPVSFSRTIVATATGTYTIGVSSNFFSGSGNLTWTADTNDEMYLRVRAA
jgi:hypothetical protein